MDEGSKKTLQNIKNEEPTEQTLPVQLKVSRCTNISILLLVLSAIIIFVPFLSAEAQGIDYWRGLYIAVICLGISGIFNVIGIISILLSKRKRCGIKRNVVALLLTALGIWVGGTALLIFRDVAIRLQIGSQMRGLSNVLAMYERDFGCLPKPEQWCDLLIQTENAEKRNFCPPSDSSGECHYAFNKHLIGHSNYIPGDVVVLFESKQYGWNQIGGEELIATTEYQPQGSWLYWKLAKVLDAEDLGRDCWIVFGSGCIKLVKPEDYDSLRWHVP